MHCHDLISVIVPVFNTEEERLKRCISSILSQSYEHIELILVDDGSTEPGCRDMLKRLQSGDDARIIIVWNMHGGVSAARNAGLERMTGKWFSFVDSDDVLMPGFLSEAQLVAQTFDADLVEGAFLESSQIDSIKRVDGEGLSECQIQKIDPGAYRESLLAGYAVVGGRCPGARVQGPVSKLFRSSLLGELRFDEKLSMGEDVYFNYRFSALCDVIVQVDRVWYGYIRHRDSLTHSRDFLRWSKDFFEFAHLPVEPAHLLALKSRLARISTDALTNCGNAALDNRGSAVKEMLDYARSTKCFSRSVRERFRLPPHRKLLYLSLDHGCLQFAYLITRLISARR